jgi:hypothetical protein
LAADLAAFASVPEPRATTLRAAPAARLAKDFLVADAMLWRPQSGFGMSCVIRGGARICCASIPFNPPCRRHRAVQPRGTVPSNRRHDATPSEHSSTVLAHWTHRKAPTGPRTRLHGHERAGDGVSPVARQLENIIPEPLEETWTARDRVTAE